MLTTCIFFFLLCLKYVLLFLFLNKWINQPLLVKVEVWHYSIYYDLSKLTTSCIFRIWKPKESKKNETLFCGSHGCLPRSGLWRPELEARTKWRLVRSELHFRVLGRTKSGCGQGERAPVQMLFHVSEHGRLYSLQLPGRHLLDEEGHRLSEWCPGLLCGVWVRHRPKT